MTIKSDLEALQKRVEEIARLQQSDKDKAIAKTNQRIDALKKDFEEFRELISQYLLEGKI